MQNVSDVRAPASLTSCRCPIWAFRRGFGAIRTRESLQTCRSRPNPLSVGVTFSVAKHGIYGGNLE